MFRVETIFSFERKQKLLNFPPISAISSNSFTCSNYIFSLRTLLILRPDQVDGVYSPAATDPCRAGVHVCFCIYVLRLWEISFFSLCVGVSYQPSWCMAENTVPRLIGPLHLKPATILLESHSIAPSFSFLHSSNSVTSPPFYFSHLLLQQYPMPSNF